MSDGPMSAEELDDAAFRARLAPLAKAILSKPAAPLQIAGSHDNARRRPRWPVVTLSALAGAAAMACGAWIYLHRSEFALMAAVRAEKPAVAEVAPPAPTPPLSDKLVPVLLQRGEAALAIGDITAARLLYERAADAGSAEAALALGKTYDIHFLLDTGAPGSAANQDLAANWYRRAADLGDSRARELLSHAEGGSRP